jgi:hypothetical protein
VHKERDEIEFADAELEDELRQAAARFDPVPREVLERAVAAFTWRTIDDDLAELVFDSLIDRDGAALVRGRHEPRLLTFQGGAMSIEVEITRTRVSCRLIGQLIPPRPATVEIRHRDGTNTIDADDLGRFTTEVLAVGPISLRCRTDEACVVTDWVSI